MPMILEAITFPRPFLPRPTRDEMFRVGQADPQAPEWYGRLGRGVAQTLGKFHGNMTIHLS